MKIYFSNSRYRDLLPLIVANGWNDDFSFIKARTGFLITIACDIS